MTGHRVLPRTLVVIGDDWPVRAAGCADAGRPVAVWSAKGILTTNAPARAAGVQVGMRRRTAQGRCPELELIAHDPARDARAFEPVVAELTTLTPWVEIIEAGVAALGTRGPSRYFGGDDALADRVLALVTDVLGDATGVRVGIADGPLVARLAASTARPGRHLVVAPGDAARFLAPIPLTALASFVPDATVLDTCIHLGLTTLADVATLPEASVTGRFGPGGIWVHRLARGADPRGLTPTPVPEDIDEVVDLDPPEVRAEAVTFAARVAAERFVTRLADRGLSCATVVITVVSDHAEELQRRWRLDGPANPHSAPQARAALIAERVRWQVDGWLCSAPGTRPSAGIIRVRLAPGAVEPARGRQLGFWGGVSAADERAARAVARLEALVGPDAVGVIKARGGRHPGSEATLVPAATLDLAPATRSVALQRGFHPGWQETGRGVPPWPGRLPAPSPTLVLDEPVPIEVLDDAGRTVEVTGRGEVPRPPALIHLDTGPARDSHDRAAQQRIVAWAGPWPVDERWWDPPTHQRQARLQILTADGTALLVTRRNHRWWLSARYA